MTASYPSCPRAWLRTLLVTACCAWGAETVHAASISLQSASRGFLGSQVAGTPDIQTYSSLSAADVAAGHRLDTQSGSAAGISVAWVDAAAGSMHAFSDATALAGSALAGNTAIVVDTLHVSSSTLAIGTAIDLALTLQFSIGYQPDGPTNAMTVGVVSYFSANDGVHSLSLFDDGPTLANGWGQVQDQPFGVLHTFVGADVTLDQRLQLNIQVDASSAYGHRLVADASHSAHFFVDTTAPVQLISQSGHDYTQRTAGVAVPEPGTAAMVLLGLWAAALRPARRARHSPSQDVAA